MRRLLHEGEKTVEDALMIPATLFALVSVARAAEGPSWVLAGSLAASCYTESRATVVIEVLVPDEDDQGAILRRVGPLPDRH
jgi:hypothetical protein